MSIRASTMRRILTRSGLFLRRTYVSIHRPRIRRTRLTRVPLGSTERHIKTSQTLFCLTRPTSARRSAARPCSVSLRFVDGREFDRCAGCGVEDVTFHKVCSQHAADAIAEASSNVSAPFRVEHGVHVIRAEAKHIVVASMYEHPVVSPSFSN